MFRFLSSASVAMRSLRRRERERMEKKKLILPKEDLVEVPNLYMRFRNLQKMNIILGLF